MGRAGPWMLSLSQQLSRQLEEPQGAPEFSRKLPYLAVFEGFSPL